MSLFQKKNVAPTTDIASTRLARTRPVGRIAPPRPPRQRSIGNKIYTVPPSRAFSVSPDTAKRGAVGGVGNSLSGAGSRPVQSAPIRMELDVQPTWHYESQYEYMGHAAPVNTPVTAGLVANDFRGLGDNFGGRQ